MRLSDVYNQLVALAQATGADFGKIGNLSSLTTTAKNSIVAAINELKATGGAGGASIDDASSDTTHTWSASKIATAIATAKSELIDGAPTAYDTLQEIAAQLAVDENSISSILTSVGNRVRYDAAQSLTAEQQLQARSNIGAMKASLQLTGDATGTASFDADGDASIAVVVAGDKVNNLGNMSGSVACAYSDGAYVVGAVIGATSLSFTDVPNDTRAYGFTLEITNGGDNITWPGNITWGTETPPTLKTSGVNLITLVTRNGGTTYIGVAN